MSKVVRLIDTHRCDQPAHTAYRGGAGYVCTYMHAYMDLFTQSFYMYTAVQMQALISIRMMYISSS